MNLPRAKLFGRISKDIETKKNEKTNQVYYYFDLTVAHGTKTLYYKIIANLKIGTNIFDYTEKGNRILLDCVIYPKYLLVERVTFIDYSKGKQLSTEEFKKLENLEDIPF